MAVSVVSVRTRMSMGAVGVVLLAAFVALGVWVHGPAPALDRSGTHLLASLRAPALTGLVEALNVALAPVLAWLAALVLAAVAARCGWQRRWDALRCALFALCGFVLVWRGVIAVKLLVDRARPSAAAAMTHVPGFSYPSGHVCSVVAVGTLAVLVSWWRGGHWRWVLVAAVLAAAVTGFDRVYLGVHYPTDVLGAALGTVGGALLVTAAGSGRWCRTRTAA